MDQTITQLTLAWLIATIEATRAGLAGDLAQTPVADWSAAPVREVRNHEQDLHTTLQVLSDMLDGRGAFAGADIAVKTKCRVCGSTDLQWHSNVVNKSEVQDGRLRAHDMDVSFFLGCNECSATVRRATGDQIAQLLTRAAQTTGKGA